MLADPIFNTMKRGEAFVVRVCLQDKPSVFDQQSYFRALQILEFFLNFKKITKFEPVKLRFKNIFAIKKSCLGLFINYEIQLRGEGCNLLYPWAKRLG